MVYRAGVIGCTVGQGHGRAYNETEEVTLAAIADIDPDQLSSAGENLGVPASQQYQDYTEMLESEDLDIVSVATPTYLHHDPTIDAVEIGDPEVVWCEKPIAGSVAEAENMVETCAAADVHLVVNHLRRWAPPYERLREAITEEDLFGEIQTVHLQFKHELLRNGTHFVDTLYWLTGERVTQVGGVLGEESPAMDSSEFHDRGGGGYMMLEDGTFVTLDCIIPRSSFTGWLMITGAGGRLYFNEFDEESRYWRIEDGEHTEESLGLFSDDWERWTTAWENAAADIVALADGETGNTSPGTEAQHVQEILTGIFVSNHTGSAVNLPLAEPLRTSVIRSR